MKNFRKYIPKLIIAILILGLIIHKVSGLPNEVKHVARLIQTNNINKVFSAFSKLSDEHKMRL